MSEDMKEILDAFIKNMAKTVKTMHLNLDPDKDNEDYVRKLIYDKGTNYEFATNFLAERIIASHSSSKVEIYINERFYNIYGCEFNFWDFVNNNSSGNFLIYCALLLEERMRVKEKSNSNFIIYCSIKL